MFKKKLTYLVKEVEALDFCAYLTKKGHDFTVSDPRTVTGSSGERDLYREITVHTTRRKAKTLESELDMGIRV